MIRILVADDHELVRGGLANLLDTSHDDWKVVAQAGNGQEAIALAEELRPDLAIVDLSMPDGDGLEVTKRLLRSIPGIKIVVLTGHAVAPVMQQLKRAGASAFLAKSEAPHYLVEAVEHVIAEKGFYASASAYRSVAELESPEEIPIQFLLTPRELDVVKGLARGLSNKEIAKELGLSVRTVETHREGIQSRLTKTSLADLIKAAIRDGLV